MKKPARELARLGDLAPGSIFRWPGPRTRWWVLVGWGVRRTRRWRRGEITACERPCGDWPLALLQRVGQSEDPWWLPVDADSKVYVREPVEGEGDE